MKNFYITTRAPLRISFFGGGTDFPKYYNKYTGGVLGCSIDRFVYVTIKSHNNLYKEKLRLNYSSTENVKCISGIKNNLIRECFKMLPIKLPVYISIISDIPTGSGLGSSSATIVGLLKALHEIRGEKIANYKLAQEACKIEIEKLKKKIGKQDQYLTAMGGINFIKFNKNEEVKIQKIYNKNICKIINNSLLIWTGNYREANNILSDQNSKINKNISILKKLYQISIEGKSIILKKKINLKLFGNLLDRNWELKKILSNKISSNKINILYKKLKKRGILGGKILGAGGGGFLFVLLNTSRNQIYFFLKNRIFFKVKPSFKGAEVILKVIY
jgi:D-glycero-alpha-D-manno-heptose-7-phosphate kinase